jgi:Peptidase inhibitor I78 family
MKHLSAVLLCAPFVLSACVTTVPPSTGPDECGASELQYLVGKPAVLLDGMRFSQDVRVIEPGMAVTMDYRPDRLNFVIDDFDVIERVYCS